MLPSNFLQPQWKLRNGQSEQEDNSRLRLRSDRFWYEQQQPSRKKLRGFALLALQTFESRSLDASTVQRQA